MQQESRLKKSFLNARVNLIFYFITLVLAFFSRKIFLDSLGADFVGLTGTLQNLLGFLNLAEMGIGAAIGYVLYRPLLDADKRKINEIISVLGYMYRCVGLFILGAGLVLSLFLPIIFADVTFQLGLIYIVYFAFIFSSLISYFINYRQTLLGADQRNYVVTAYYQSANICKIIIQMLLASYTHNYLLWIAIELLFGILYSLILNNKINQVYPWLKSDVRLGGKILKKYPDVIKYTKQLFIHKIGYVVYTQVTPFLVYAFASLQTVAYYGNYTLVVAKLDSLINNILTSTSAGVGSLIAEGDKNKIIKVYWELMAIRFWIVGIFIFILYNLLPAFVSLWLGKQYVMSENVLVLVLINFFLGSVRGTNEQFILGYGLFADVWSPFAEACLLIGVAILGGRLWGFEGVLLGTIISTVIIIYIWKPYYLFKNGFKLPLWEYWLPWVKHLFLMIASLLVSNMIVCNINCIHTSDTWYNLVLSALIIAPIHVFIITLFFYIGTKGLRDFVKRVLSVLNKYTKI